MDRKRLGSFVIGGLAGMIAGVLLAPRSGRETRGAIVNRAGEARQQGSESYFDARERISERISSARENPTPPGSHVAGGKDAPPETTHETPPRRPVLRDVSSEGSAGRPGDETEVADRSEALRRKVRETREKLRDISSEGESEGGSDDTTGGSGKE